MTSTTNSEKFLSRFQKWRDMEEGQKRLQARYILLTYHHHYDYHDLVEHFQSEFPTFPDMAVSICHETGKSTGVDYEHTHVVIDFKKQLDRRSKNAYHIFDLELEEEIILKDGTKTFICHPNIKFLNSRKAYDDALDYIQKEDENCYINQTEPDDIMATILNAQSNTDIFKLCHKLSDVPAIMKAIELNRMFATRDSVDVEFPHSMYDWQLYMLSLVHKSESDRKVSWIWEPKGNIGKSIFAAYLSDRFPDDVSLLDCIGNRRDFSTIIESEINRGWNGKLLIIDLPRSAEDYSSIYQCLEAIKNGRITTTKYRGSCLRLKFCSHIVVLANFPPQQFNDYGKPTMSLDRWFILKALPNVCEDVPPLTDYHEHESFHTEDYNDGDYVSDHDRLPSDHNSQVPSAKNSDESHPSDEYSDDDDDSNPNRSTSTIN